MTSHERAPQYSDVTNSKLLWNRLRCCGTCGITEYQSIKLFAPQNFNLKNLRTNPGSIIVLFSLPLCIKFIIFKLLQKHARWAFLSQCQTYIIIISATKRCCLLLWYYDVFYQLVWTYTRILLWYQENRQHHFASPKGAAGQVHTFSALRL